MIACGTPVENRWLQPLWTLNNIINEYSNENERLVNIVYPIYVYITVFLIVQYAVYLIIIKLY